MRLVLLALLVLAPLRMLEEPTCTGIDDLLGIVCE